MQRCFSSIVAVIITGVQQQNFHPRGILFIITSFFIPLFLLPTHVSFLRKSFFPHFSRKIRGKNTFSIGGAVARDTSNKRSREKASVTFANLTLSAIRKPGDLSDRPWLLLYLRSGSLLILFFPPVPSARVTRVTCFFFRNYTLQFSGNTDAYYSFCFFFFSILAPSILVVDKQQ